jgi:hypothetical protein
VRLHWILFSTIVHPLHEFFFFVHLDILALATSSLYRSTIVGVKLGVVVGGGLGH